MDIDPHNLGDPVYKRDQVITREDMDQIIDGFVWQYENTPAISIAQRRALKHAISTAKAIKDWLLDGKKVYNV